jgi:hypothetical protein
MCEIIVIVTFLVGFRSSTWKTENMAVFHPFRTARSGGLKLAHQESDKVKIFFNLTISRILV